MRAEEWEERDRKLELPIKLLWTDFSIISLSKQLKGKGGGNSCKLARRL